MLYYLLGVLTGLLLAVIMILAVKRLQKPIERTLSQLENSVKERGEVFYESDEKVELDTFLDSLPKE